MVRRNYEKIYNLFFINADILFTNKSWEVIWEENFDNLDNWIIETGNGSWGWGNGELQYYKPENVEIVEVPEETGNNAVQITAKEESGADITDQWGNPLHYTSGQYKI